MDYYVYATTDQLGGRYPSPRRLNWRLRSPASKAVVLHELHRHGVDPSQARFRAIGQGPELDLLSLTPPQEGGIFEIHCPY